MQQLEAALRLTAKIQRERDALEERCRALEVELRRTRTDLLGARELAVRISEGSRRRFDDDDVERLFQEIQQARGFPHHGARR